MVMVMVTERKKGDTNMHTFTEGVNDQGRKRRREMTESQTQAKDVFIISPTSTLLQCLLVVLMVISPAPPAPPRQ